MSRFAVLGAGVTGLAAAWEFERNGHDVVVFDAAPRVGGKLQRSPVAGLSFPLDEGADAFLARVPDALELCAELGIEDLRHPSARNAMVYAAGALHPLPAEQVLGLPADLDAVAASGLVSKAGIARARRDLEDPSPPPSDDLSVGELIRTRLGDEVCDHLVEPLLGGINGGCADGLSTRACAAQIWAAAQRGGSLIEAAAAMRANADPTAHVFATPAAGMAEIPATLATRLLAEIRASTAVESISLAPTVTIDADSFAGVVVATPADAAATLLAGAAPDAAALLGSIEFASVAMVTLVCDRAAVDHPLDASGLVVARTAGLSITAASFGSSKWDHWDDGTHVVFRVSMGHDGDPTDWCAHDDVVLTRTAVDDLTRVLDTEIRPVGVRVGRWPGSFPQYRPGHLDRVDAIRDAVHAAGSITIAGMSYDGIGVPASIASGRTAARRLIG